MNKELEEAITLLKDKDCLWNNPEEKILSAIKIVVDRIENSIPKEVIEKYLKEEQERFNVYKKEVDKNENLKFQLWNHLGRKNMCEKILGIEKTVTLD